MSGMLNSRWICALLNLSVLAIVPEPVRQLITPSATEHLDGCPSCVRQWELSFPSNRTMASDGAFAALPGSTTGRCGPDGFGALGSTTGRCCPSLLWAPATPTAKTNIAKIH